MKREIKFRGYGKQIGMWFYGCLDTLSIPSPRIMLKNSEGEVFSVEVIPETVGQFTGLYDKNGKEIYEGDIIAILDGDYVVRGSGKVEWLEKWGIWYVDGNGESNDGLGDLRFNYDFEVIGNIYDNKEQTQN